MNELEKEIKQLRVCLDLERSNVRIMSAQVAKAHGEADTEAKEARRWRKKYEQVSLTLQRLNENFMEKCQELAGAFNRIETLESDIEYWKKQVVKSQEDQLETVRFLKDSNGNAAYWREHYEKIISELTHVKHECKQWQDLVKIMEDKTTDNPNTENFGGQVEEALRNIVRRIRSINVNKDKAYVATGLHMIAEDIENLLDRPKGWTHTD